MSEKDGWRRRGKGTHLPVVEKRIIPPGERLDPAVEVLVLRGLREHAVVLMSDMLDVREMFGFEVIHPRADHRDCANEKGLEG